MMMMMMNYYKPKFALKSFVNAGYMNHPPKCNNDENDNDDSDIDIMINDTA
jgi:hypothetical protein